jgi:hypothetical protein
VGQAASGASLNVDTTAKRVVSHAGAVLLAATARRVGLDHELSAALRSWMRPLAIHTTPEVRCWTWRCPSRSVATAWPASLDQVWATTRG